MNQDKAEREFWRILRNDKRSTGGRKRKGKKRRRRKF